MMNKQERLNMSRIMVTTKDNVVQSRQCCIEKNHSKEFKPESSYFALQGTDFRGQGHFFCT